MYATVKAKCYRDVQEIGNEGSPPPGQREDGLVCLRAGHSHMRKICSWWHYPFKEWLRWQARAMRAVLVMAGVGHAVPHLKGAADAFRAKVLGLPARTPGSCCRCRGEKPRRLAVVSGDAGQMYENVRPQDVVDILALLVAKAAGRGYAAVTMIQKRHSTAWLAMHVHVAKAGTKVVALSTLVPSMQLALSHDVVKVGGSMVRQKGGVPIGGLTSDVAAGLLLGGHEEIWDHRCRVAETQQTAGGQDVGGAVAQLRYVDDVVLASFEVCSACLMAQILRQYPGVPFEVQPSVHGGTPWLDLLILPRGGREAPMVVMLPQELRWLAGELRYPTRFRLPPYLGDRHVDRNVLRGMVRGRLARFRQVGLDFGGLRAALVNDLAIWDRSGYPADWSRKLWRHNVGGGWWRQALEQASASLQTWDGSYGALEKLVVPCFLDVV